MEELAELPEGPTVCREVARGGGVFIGLLLGVTKLTVLTEAERRTGPNMSLH